MPLDALLGLATANFLVSLTPGQNTALVASCAARHGTRAGLWVVGGVLAADLGWTVLALSMIDGLLVLSPDHFEAAQRLGGAVLILMGLMLLLPGGSPQAAGRGWRFGTERGFLSGLLVGTANPMALIFFLSMLPQFIEDAAPRAVLFVLSGAVIVLSSAAALAPYVMFSAARETRYERAVVFLSAAAMMTLGVVSLARIEV